MRLRQVNEDLHSYYLLTYSPRNQDYDGGYRRISVRVTRTGADVQARKGYYALRGSYDSPILEYEVPALAVLSRKTVTDAFQTHCAAFSFPEPTRPGLVPVVVEVPPGAINFLVDKAKTKYSADFSIVALIRDPNGHVARKLSTHYLLNGPYDKLEAALNGNILFYKETRTRARSLLGLLSCLRRSREAIKHQLSEHHCSSRGEKFIATEQHRVSEERRAPLIREQPSFKTIPL